jgi:hypothetical protein
VDAVLAEGGVERADDGGEEDGGDDGGDDGEEGRGLVSLAGTERKKGGRTEETKVVKQLPTREQMAKRPTTMVATVTQKATL